MPAIGTRSNSFTDSGNTGMTDNPVFKVKVRGLQTNYEQPPPQVRPELNDEVTDDFKISDVVTGQEKNGNKTYTGQIIAIEKNGDGDGSTVTIISNKQHKTIKLDATTCTKETVHDGKTNKQEFGDTNTPQFYVENFILSFDNWRKINS